MDKFSIQSGDNKYKLDCLWEIYRRRDAAFRYACFFCGGMLLYLTIMGVLQFNFMLAGRYPNLPPIAPVTFFVVPLVFIPAFFALLMKPAGTVLTILVFMVFTALYFLDKIYMLIPFTVAGAVFYLRQNAVFEGYFVLAEEEGFPEFSDFTFERKTDGVENDN
jgi:prepilin signal peptidase PulO-like enzyme (type II secretory pathway)